MHNNVNALFTQELCVHSLAMTHAHNKDSKMVLDIKSPKIHFLKIPPEKQ